MESPTKDSKRRVAVYGGAYDPIQNAHLTCAAEIIHSGAAEEVWLVPCGPRPDKPKLKTPPIDRYVMCQIAVNTMFSPCFPIKVSDAECFGSEAMFTYDLLSLLREKHPDTEFVFVIGTDWLQEDTNIAKWDSKNHAWKAGDPEDQKTIITGDKLLEEFHFLVVRRPGYEVTKTSEDPTGLKRFGPKLHWLDMPDNMSFVEGNLSSTEVRKRNGLPQGFTRIEGLVPPGVLAYIKRGGLYR